VPFEDLAVPLQGLSSAFSKALFLTLYRFRARREQLKWFQDFRTENFSSQSLDLALTGIFLPSSIVEREPSVSSLMLHALGQVKGSDTLNPGPKPQTPNLETLDPKSQSQKLETLNPEP